VLALAAAAALACGPVAPGAGGADPARAREEMVAAQIEARGVRDARTLAAMRKVPRHLFVPAALAGDAYADHPLPIGHGQTISQPYIVAFMSQALKVQPENKVLEIGTGSGYQAAVLAELARDVYSIEIVEPLGERARATLTALGYRNVHVRIGDGYRGWPEEAPFDRIVVTAAPVEIPAALVEQLAIGGLMAIPVGDVMQELRILRKTESGLETLETMPVRFVPMVRSPPKPPDRE